MPYIAVSVESKKSPQSVQWYLTAWRTPFDCSLLAVCRTQALAEAMRDALMGVMHDKRPGNQEG